MKKFSKVSIIVLAVAFTLGLGGIIAVRAAPAATAPTTLGAAESYAIYSNAGETNANVGTRIWGNVGDNGVGRAGNGLTVTQVPLPSVIDNGVGVWTAATTAYNELLAQVTATPGTILNLAVGVPGATITPGIYNVQATTLNGTLTLDGAGVYILSSTSSISTSSDGLAILNLINGATACNVFWQIPTSMTIGTNAHIEGTIIASTGNITLGTGASLKGRALSHTQITMDNNQITEPICSADLSITKTVDVATPDIGDTIVYIVTVTNDGSDDATGVVVKDLLPAGLSYVSNVSSQGTYIFGTGVWTVGAIANGASKTLTITATVDTDTGGDTITNTAEVTASDQTDADSTPNNNILAEDDQELVDVVVNTPVVHHSRVIGSMPRVVVPVFEPTITILSTPVVIVPIIPKLPKTGFAPQESGIWYESLLNNILDLFR